MVLRKHLMQIVYQDHHARRALAVVLEVGGFSASTSDTCAGAELEATSPPPDVLIVRMAVPNREPRLVRVAG